MKLDNNATITTEFGIVTVPKSFVTRQYFLTVYSYDNESYDLELESAGDWLTCLTYMLKQWIGYTGYYHNDEFIKYIYFSVDNEGCYIPYDLMDEVINRIALSYIEE